MDGFFWDNTDCTRIDDDFLDLETGAGGCRHLEYPEMDLDTEEQNGRNPTSSGRNILVLMDVQGLESFYLRCLGPLGASFLDETDPFPFTQGLESFTFNGTIVNKHVTSVVRFDEPKPLAVIEPFYSTFRHFLIPSLNCGF